MPHTLPAWGIALRFRGSVIAAVVVVQFSLFRYLIFFNKFYFIFQTILFCFFQYFFIFIQLYVQLSISIVCLFITFLQALVHWYAYDSCFVGSGIYYQLSLGVD